MEKTFLDDESESGHRRLINLKHVVVIYPDKERAIAFETVNLGTTYIYYKTPAEREAAYKDLQHLLVHIEAIPCDSQP